MKQTRVGSRSVLLFAPLLSTLAASAAFAAPAPAVQNMTVITTSPADVFTPKGFDSYNNVEVILAGSLSSFCFHEAPSVTRFDPATNRVYVENQVYSFDDCVGGMMYIPYTNVVSLGAMSAGNYEVWSSDGKGGYEKRADLPVAQALPSPYGTDSELYAPVSEIAFVPASAGDPSLTIKGAFSNSCMSLGNVSVAVVEGNVVQVLPIANYDQNADCQAGTFPFSESARLTGFPADGDVLIHVRSLGGQALNRVITPLDRVGLGN